jgi:hypothetical protein
MMILEKVHEMKKEKRKKFLSQSPEYTQVIDSHQMQKTTTQHFDIPKKSVLREFITSNEDKYSKI